MISLKSIDVHTALLEFKYVDSYIWLPCMFILYIGFLNPVHSFLFFQLNIALLDIFELTLTCYVSEDVLTDDKGECVICLEDLQQGDTIARLPCLCIYHKRSVVSCD